ncbi:hypothetical protein NJB1907f44_37480 [Mycobacterium marinum]|uniref:hypothetical protein n=2 Tax=Mycobacterium marinum TaxID=1781 RepID=UPI000E3D993D|nr:hypothetical protein [Mycobacterium marinum]RFZ45910.1 hypothetical protein KST_00148 [Mycobacterium marinum]GJO06430.1 hypothetical protein NJB1808e29_35610 [Mycobacterium marinum]GJO30635.1 hypothetical protein NJB1907E19_01420 [Mycobacterium marinum]GJO48203.1 hypothetical protein NJB1728e24_40630 [Mycobacterium marinum]GJO70362.1 hypothetical protein NJB1907f34a_25120 [Mycobacterium marinum]
MTGKLTAQTAAEPAVAGNRADKSTDPDLPDLALCEVNRPVRVTIPAELMSLCPEDPDSTTVSIGKVEVSFTTLTHTIGVKSFRHFATSFPLLRAFAEQLAMDLHDAIVARVPAAALTDVHVRVTKYTRGSIVMVVDYPAPD